MGGIFLRLDAQIPPTARQKIQEKKKGDIKEIKEQGYRRKKR